jgi:amino acid permease
MSLRLLRHRCIPPRDLKDRRLFHSLSLIAFLAWVGLGADGLSSAAYGPAEAFINLGKHTYLAIGLALATATTVLIISAAYSRIIAAFPQGGGGYIVATDLLGAPAGVVAGCALMVDYVLTITVSIAAAGDALFSLVPTGTLEPSVLAELKIITEIVVMLALITANIRGVREAIIPLVPVFLLFLLTHAILIGGGLAVNVQNVGEVDREASHSFRTDLATIGIGGILLIFVRAYSLGAGTYTGIEAVSNGLSLMREPRVQTGQRTMRYMSISLALTAGGLLLCFLLMGLNASHEALKTKTLNAILAETVSDGLPGAPIFVWLTLLAEAALLFVAAQAGFIGGPRVLANMALDGWVPRRFASLSDRLTSANGIMLMGFCALVALLGTRGHVSTLVIMYSINVFITFALSMGGMLRQALDLRRRSQPQPRFQVTLFTVGLVLCMVILGITSVEKFGHGGWITLSVTTLLVVLCFRIRGHYRKVRRQVAQLERIVDLPKQAGAVKVGEPDRTKPTAVILVGGYNGLGIHTALAAMQAFRGYFKNLVFVSVGVIDSSAFKSPVEMEAVTVNTRASLERYVTVARQLGVPATFYFSVGTDAVDELEKLCPKVAKDFPNSNFFAGKLIFQRERWYHTLLHNQTAFSLQRRLQWAGLPVLVLPIRVK